MPQQPIHNPTSNNDPNDGWVDIPAPQTPQSAQTPTNNPTPQSQPSSDSDWQDIPAATAPKTGLLDRVDNAVPALGSLDQFGKGVWEQTGQPVAQMLTQNPLKTARQIGSTPGQVVQGEEQMIDNAKKVDNDPKSTPVQQFDAGLYMIPGVGPMLKNMDDQYKQGKVAEAYGQAAGLIASILGPHALSGENGAPAMLGDNPLSKPVTPIKPNVSQYMNKYIGLQPSDLSKYQRLDPSAPQDIGWTVYNEVGMKNNLLDQKTAIDQGIQNRLANTQALLRNADNVTPPVDLHHVLIDSAVDLVSDLEKSGATQDQIKAVDSNLKGLEANYAGQFKPSQALAARNNIRSQITTWDPNTTNVRQRYLQQVYHSLNDAIDQTLAPEDAKAFRDNNQTVHRLIIASNAAGEKLAKAGMQAQGPIRTVGNVLTLHAAHTLANHFPEGLDLKAGATGSAAMQRAKSVIQNPAAAVQNLPKPSVSDIARFTRGADLLSQTDQQDNK